MRRSLFMYLFIIALLMNVFTYAYFSKQAQFETRRLENKVKNQSDSLTVLYNQWLDAGHFSLLQNQNAQDYLNVDPVGLSEKISAELIDLNTRENGNPMVPYEQINERKFVINKVKVINHRWIIADFTDGNQWGELLLKYFIENDGSITYERLESQLYPQQR